MLNFNQLLEQYNKQLALEIEILEKRTPKNLYAPVVYTLNMGGKRIRPILLLMAYNLFNSDIKKAYPAANAIEVFHNFTLLHDDIMDNAELRRNYQTVHIKYSEEAAILSGDAMSILSYEFLNKCQTTKHTEVFDLFNQTSLQICEGQQLDMDFESRTDVTVDEYLKMIKLKTAVLLATSLKLAALIAEAPSADSELLYNFGINLGMAFQLQDDLLDSFGNTKTFGKNIGGDIVSNKKTFLMLKAFELAQGKMLEKLNNWTTATNFDKDEKINEVKAIYTELGVVNLSKQKMDEYYAIAIDNLRKVNVAENKKEELFLIASQMMKRKN